MPPVRTTDRPRLVVFTCNRRKVVVARPPTYAAAARLARKVFPILKHIPVGRIKFSAVVPDFPNEGEVEIGPLAWRIAANGVDAFNVNALEDKEDRGKGGTMRRQQRRRPQPHRERVGLPMIRRSPPAVRAPGRGRGLSIIARMRTANASTDFIVNGLEASHRVLDLKNKIHEVSGVCASEQTLWLGDILLEDNRGLSEYPFSDGALVTIVRSLGFAKPVIYLYPPTPTRVNVKISISGNWTFSALYPKTKKGALKDGQVAEWDVLAKPDGSMSVSESSVEVAYLFWEAENRFMSELSELPETPPPSRPPSPLRSSKAPDSQAVSISRIIVCSAKDSVLLAVEDVPLYLDKALTALGLHTEARTSFITYWLPSILKHDHIALRFVPQTEYEAAAPLEISPHPDIVTRIFMVFQGISADRLQDWKIARERASESVDFWKSTVGIEESRQNDGRLFRVLEWGGMEIH